MSRIPKDPLLLVARLLLKFFIILFSAALVARLIAALAISFPYAQRQIADFGLADGAKPWDFTQRLAVMLVLVLVLFGGVFLFALFLRKVMDTVSTGDPFTSENADRLQNMGWIMVVLTFAIPPIPYVIDWINELLEEKSTANNLEFSGNGLLLALVLFILARVFRQGAAMRSDLEGTV